MLASEVPGSSFFILSTLDMELVEEATNQGLGWPESDCPFADDNFTLASDCGAGEA